MVETEATFCFYGQIPPKSNYKYSRRSKKSREMWGRIKEFQNQIGHLAIEAGLKGPRLAVEGEVVIVGWKQRIDPGNYDKPILDALEAVVFVNDRHVDSTGRRGKVPDVGPPRAEITVRRGRMETVEEQKAREVRAFKRKIAKNRKAKGRAG